MPNPFAVFDLEARFDLDPAELHRRYVEACARNHPDRFTDALEQADAAARTAEINRAYQVLRDPERRAGALLEILGGIDRADDKSLPPELLPRMMEVREELETATAENDQPTLARLRAWAEAQHAEHLARIEQLLRQAQAADPERRPDLLRQTRVMLNALRYFQRLREQMTA